MQQKITGTRERILEAARQIFLERGYAKATIRDICNRAGANVAAVHYHFQDKAGVHKAVLDELMGAARRRFPLTMGLGEEPTARQRLTAYIVSLLHRVLLSDGEEDFESKVRLVAEALLTQSPYLDSAIEGEVRPLLTELEVILVELLGEDVPHKMLLACAASVLGQCLHYFYARPIIDRLNTGLYRGPEDVLPLAEHVVTFSLGGLQAVMEQHRARQRRAEEDADVVLVAKSGGEKEQVLS